MLRFLGTLLIFLAPSLAFADNLCTAIFYKSVENSHMDTNDFATGRHLTEYSYEFEFRDSAPFSEVLLELPPKSVWFDMGFGQGFALKEGLQANTDIHGVGVAYKRPSNKTFADFVSVQDRVTFLEGDFVEIMALQGRLDPWRGQVSLITDVYGPLSYTHDLSRVLQVYMDLLKPGGVVMFNMGVARNYVDDHYLPEMEMINTVVFRGQTGQTAFYQWLLNIPGVEVADMVPRRVQFDGRIGAVLAIKLRKISESVAVPELQLLDYVEGKPPHRMFIAPY